jgi:hypothetical protein
LQSLANMISAAKEIRRRYERLREIKECKIYE